jgi:hypothetical protein
LPGCKYAFKVIQDKAPFAGNGRPLFKDGDAVLDHPGGALQAYRKGVAGGVAPLDTYLPIPAR